MAKLRKTEFWITGMKDTFEGIENGSHGSLGFPNVWVSAETRVAIADSLRTAARRDAMFSGLAAEADKLMALKPATVKGVAGMFKMVDWNIRLS